MYCEMRRISKFYVIPFILLTVIYFIIVILLEEPKEYSDKKYKLEIIDEAIRANNVSGICQIPNLPVNSPEMMTFIHDEPPIDCGTDEDWVSCKGSLCSIKKSAIAEYGVITCDFMDIIRNDNDNSFKYGKAHRSTDQYVLYESDFAQVNCWTSIWGSSWSGILIGIRKKLNLDHLQKSNGNLNVLMFGFDSLSKNAFIRKLPKTYEYLTHKLHGDVLQGYNIVGDGTPQALIPILTGFTELELPETRRRITDSNFVNVYPMIWQKYQKMGYVTAFNEDLPDVGTFSYRLNGFNDQPTNHYMRPFYLAAKSEMGHYKRLCLGDRPRHQIMIDYTAQFMQHYNKNPKFVFSFHGELSHDSINLIGVADNDIHSWLMDLNQNGILNDTILILMSDHGNRFAKVRDTLQGKLEERLPFFSFVFPKWFKELYKIQYANFKNNLQRLTTPFDIHETLEDILRFKSGTYRAILKQSSNNRAISLFDQIPANRTCSDAYIEPHWCVCLNWQPITNTIQNENVLNAAQAIVAKINSLTLVHRDVCEMLRLHEIKWAAKLAPHDNLLHFKQNKDFDGFLADLSSTTTKITSELYQIKIIVKPGKSIFEASVQHDLINDQFKVKASDISRVNKYGNQASCIMIKNPEIRKYCYCKGKH